MFLIQIKNIFACRQANVGSSMHACQFRHADLVAGKTGKQSDKAPNSDFGQTVLAFSINHDSVSQKALLMKCKNCSGTLSLSRLSVIDPNPLPPPNIIMTLLSGIWKA